MFTLEESALLARMLRVVGWLTVCLLAGVVLYVLHHVHPLAHAARTALPAAGLSWDPAARAARRRWHFLLENRRWM